MPSHAVTLTQNLVRLDTINPPGNEQAAADLLAEMLREAGFSVRDIPLAKGRPNLIAKIGGTSDKGAKPPLAFTGHLDTVPLGLAPWSVAPHGGDIKDGKIWGRGSSDMKSGVAAFVAVCLELAPRLKDTPGVVLYITSGEETGLEGALVVARENMTGDAGALIVAEPTSNRPVVGHRGALWLKAITTGVTAHGSMPEKGVNAVYKAARAITALENFDFNVARHPVMGAPSLNVGFAHGGINVNSVPDRTEVGIDLRTIPGMQHDALRDQIASYLGPDVTVETTSDVASLYTDPEDPWIKSIFDLCTELHGTRPAIETAPYITDAAALTPALGDVPTVILGPGPAHMAHQTDEYCEIEKINEAVEIYRRLITQWCDL